jgi:hypothetical protein
MDIGAIIVVTVTYVTATLIAADGRHSASPRQQIFALRNTLWQTVFEDERYSGWFRRNLRVSKQTFIAITEKVRTKWSLSHPEPYRNSHFTIDKKVALTMYFLSMKGAFHHRETFLVSVRHEHIYISTRLSMFLWIIVCLKPSNLLILWRNGMKFQMGLKK